MERKKINSIIGYGKYSEKETGEMMLRILIVVPRNHENYYGDIAVPVYLNWSQVLENSLKTAIDDPNSVDCYYTTNEDIVTGKTKVDNIYIEQI